AHEEPALGRERVLLRERQGHALGPYARIVLASRLTGDECIATETEDARADNTPFANTCHRGRVGADPDHPGISDTRLSDQTRERVDPGHGGRAPARVR